MTNDNGSSNPAAPMGWKLVPVELTERMCDEADFAMQNHVGDAYTESDDFDGWYRPIWSAMLAASPAAPAQSGEPVYAYIYEYETAFGLHRQLEPGTYNGSDPTRTVKVYAAPQPSPTAVVLDEEPLWDHKGNVRHDAVDRLGERQRAARAASPQPVEQEASNMVEIDRRDLFDFVRGGVKSALEAGNAGEGMVASWYWQEATERTERVLGNLGVFGVVAQPVEQTRALSDNTRGILSDALSMYARKHDMAPAQRADIEQALDRLTAARPASGETE